MVVGWTHRPPLRTARASAQRAVYCAGSREFAKTTGALPACGWHGHAGHRGRIGCLELLFELEDLFVEIGNMRTMLVLLAGQLIVQPGDLVSGRITHRKPATISSNSCSKCAHIPSGSSEPSQSHS